MAERQKNRQHNGRKTEEQTTQWPKDRRTDNTMAKRQKNRQHNGRKKINKKTNNDLQNIQNQWLSNTIHTKNRGELRCSARVCCSSFTSDTRRLNLVTNRWSVMNEKRTGKCLRQVVHIRGHLSVYDKWNISVVIWVFTTSGTYP